MSYHCRQLLLPICLCLVTLGHLHTADDAQLTAAADHAVNSFVFIGGGSGAIIDPTGIMLTNHHVAGDRHEWVVRHGERLYRATALGHDPIGDLTALQIHGDGPFPYLEIGDSEALVVGQTVIAVGNPFATATGFNDPTVTAGIISALNRFQGTYSDAIQHDAPINPGNSGGPLVDGDGRLIGINGRISTRTGARANTGIGQAIPADQIRRFLPLLVSADGGLVRHGLLRGAIGNNDEDDNLRNGAEIQSVVAGSAAADAGLQAGDRIVNIDGKEVMSLTRMLGIIGTYPAEADITMVAIRNDERVTLTATLTPNDPPDWGARLSRQGPRHIVLTNVRDNSPAAAAGILDGDRLLSIDGAAVGNGQALRTWLSSHQPQAGETLELELERIQDDDSFTNMTVNITLGSRLESAIPQNR